MSDHEEAPCFKMELAGAVPHDRFDPRDRVVSLSDGGIGQGLTVSDVVGKPTILNFFTTW